MQAKQACRAGVLIWWVNVTKLTIVYSTGHVWFGDKGSGEGRGQGKAKYSVSHLSPYFSLLLTPMVIISFSHPSIAIRVKDSFDSCCKENTEPSHAKIPPALQAKAKPKLSLWGDRRVVDCTWCPFMPQRNKWDKMNPCKPKQWGIMKKNLPCG